MSASSVGNEASGLDTGVSGFSFGVKVGLFGGKEEKAEFFLTVGNNVDRQNRLHSVCWKVPLRRTFS
jgi:hypothetical protein